LKEEVVQFVLMRSGVGGLNKNKKTGIISKNSGGDRGPKPSVPLTGRRNKLSPFTVPAWLNKKVQKKPDDIIKINGRWTRIKKKN
jgi:hypothetical protein